MLKFPHTLLHLATVILYFSNPWLFVTLFGIGLLDITPKENGYGYDISESQATPYVHKFGKIDLWNQIQIKPSNCAPMPNFNVQPAWLDVSLSK